MPELIRVGMADYKVGKAPATIISYGLGSCIGISLYDPQLKVGGLLHIMLPDSTQARPSDNPAKFADTGLPLMLKDVLALGAVKSRLVAKMAGGAQMFAFANATDIMRVGARNADAAKKMLQKLGIKIIAEDTPENLAKRLGEFTVEYFGADRKTQYRYFPTKAEADEYAKTLDDTHTVTVRRTNLSDSFVEMTGNKIGDNGFMLGGAKAAGGKA